jgi:hypothetical protein
VVPPLAGPARVLTLLAFFWGGGLLVAAGVAESVGQPGGRGDILAFDPSNGWWMLNFGRTLVLSTEAWYHALFFGTIVALMVRRFGLAVVLLTVMAMSHPFTGLQLLAIVGVWALMECYAIRTTAIPRWLVVACIALGAAHVGYYLGFLGRFPEHAQLVRQWTQPWTLPLGTLLFAYALVAALALWTLRSRARLRAYFATPDHRLLAVWCVVSLALAKHELFMRPVQPVHFTRGYIWTPLFLMGAPTLQRGLGQLAEWRRPVLRAVALTGIITLFLADNTVWLATVLDAELFGRGPQAQFGGPAHHLGIALSADDDELFRWLGRAENRGGVVLSEDPLIGYLTTVYTSLRAWSGHHYNTPWGDQRRAELAALYQQGRVGPVWRSMPLLVVWPRAMPMPAPVGGLITDSTRVAFENRSYRVIRAGRW